MTWESGLFIPSVSINMKSEEQIEISLKVFSMKCQDKRLSWITELNERTVNLAGTIQKLSELFQTRAHFAGFNNKQPK